jgi:hypothetical protein
MEQYTTDIEKYITENKDSELIVTCNIQTFRGLEYLAIFEEPDNKGDYKHYVHATGKSLEEVIRKLATYINSDETYNDKRYL